MTLDEEFEDHERRPRTPNPELKERIGEDPARFLGRDVATSDPFDLTMVRIRGIDSREVLDAWFAIESEVFQRVPILTALNERRVHLKEHGYREDVLDALDEERLAASREMTELVDELEAEEPDPAFRDSVCGSTDVERRSRHMYYCPDCDVAISTASDRVEEVEAT